jgi:hypothetical protein
MKEEQFGRKIASILNEAPLEKRIEERLASARNQALLKMNENKFIEVNEHKGSITLKYKMFENQSLIKWSGLFVLGLLILMLQQNNNNILDDVNTEPVQIFSTEYMRYTDTLNIQKESFEKWKSEVEDIIDN